jgi:hypothetical protein
MPAMDADEHELRVVGQMKGYQNPYSLKQSLGRNWRGFDAG